MTIEIGESMDRRVGLAMCICVVKYSRLKTEKAGTNDFVRLYVLERLLDVEFAQRKRRRRASQMVFETRFSSSDLMVVVVVCTRRSGSAFRFCLCRSEEKRLCIKPEDDTLKFFDSSPAGGKPHGRESTPVLAAALNESMRSKPVGPVVIRRATADHFVCVGGSIPPFTIRKGDSVVIDLASMHSDAEVFDAPDGFDAVRNFLDARGREQHKFRPFGHGR